MNAALFCFVLAADSLALYSPANLPVAARDSSSALAFVSATAEMPRLPGDLNGDGAIRTSDIVYLVNYVLKDGPAPQPDSTVRLRLLWPGRSDSAYTFADGLLLVRPRKVGP